MYENMEIQLHQESLIVDDPELTECLQAFEANCSNVVVPMGQPMPEVQRINYLEVIQKRLQGLSLQVPQRVRRLVPAMQAFSVTKQ